MGHNEKTILVDGLNIHYWEAGEGNGRTLLLLPGGVGDAALHWGPVIPMLAETFHVLAPDLPGFAGSQSLRQKRVDTMIHWIKAFLDTLKIDQVVVVGNSLGGLLVRLFAVAYPQRVPALILVNGGGVPDLPTPLRLIERIPLISNLLFSLLGQMATAPDTLNRMIYIKAVLNEQFQENVHASRKGYTALMRMLIGSPFSQAQTPAVPTLILWGTDDQLATLNEAKAIKDSIPGATLTEIKDCGHMPQLETPDVFVWQITTFLEKLSRPRASDLPGVGVLPDLPS